MSAALMVPQVAAAADAPKTPTFTKDIAPIFQEKCEACHRPDSIAPMSLKDFSRSPAVGSIDQGARHRSPDAAVADRSQRRHPEVQERSVAHRRADRHDRSLGRRRRAAGRSERHAEAEDLAGRSGLELRAALRSEGTGSDHQVVPVHDAGRLAGCVGQARHAVGHHRAALGSRDRDPSRRR